MIGLPRHFAERLDSGFTRLFTIEDEQERSRGLQETLAGCGLRDYRDLHAAVQGPEHCPHLLEQDRDLLAFLADEPWFLFMNHGYAPAVGEEGDFPLLEGDADRWRHQIYLYCYLLNFAKPRLPCLNAGTCDLLDVGCGRGGGLAAMKRYYGLHRAVGIDANPHQIAFCADRHAASGLEFAQGSAMAIPLDSESVDIVTNVESSHCYEDLRKYLSEVRRVLRPGGLLLLADNRESGRGTRLTLEAALLVCGLRPLHWVEITERVRQACLHDAERFGRVFAQAKAEALRQIAARSEMAYSSGAGVYLAYVLQKPSG